MTEILKTLADNPGARKTRTRVGRGIGSGKGKTGGRGHKGQKARSGVAINGFEGGQMPIFRRLPKRGFNNPSRKEFEVVNIGQLAGFVELKKIKATGITLEALVEAGICHGNKDGLKMLAKGELKGKLEITVHKASKAAIEAVEKAGGKVTIVEAAKTPQKKKAVANETKGATKDAKAA